MPAWLTTYLHYGAEWLPAILNSNFITALAGAGLGAFAGAYIAQRIAERAKSRDEILRELRNTNSAIRLAITVCNVCITLKKQHVKALKETYDKKRAELIALKTAHRGNHPPAIFEFVADFNTLPPILIPPETYQILQTLILEKITATSKTTNLVPMLLQSIDLFNSITNERNRLIEEIRKGPRDDDTVGRLYFGLPDLRGNVDVRYGNMVEGMSSYIDDCIFFSKAIADDLGAQGKKMRAYYIKKSKAELPTIVRLEIDQAHHEFLPEAKEYPGWDKMA